MKKLLFLLSLCALLLPAPAMAQVDTLAKQAIIVDADTGAVLLDKSANERMPTSSMSKLMTMYIVFEALKSGHLKLDDTQLINESAWSNSMKEGSRMYLELNSRVKIEDLVRGVIIQSGNDASVALAEAVAGSETAFADAMNVRAKEIGLSSSHFVNATGLPDPDHYSSPRDLALLAFRLIKDFPEYYHYFSEKEFTYNKIKQQNRDPLLGRVNGADGLKTGHTAIAGYGLVGSAKRETRRVILVINGLPSEKARQEEGVKLMEWAFRNFENKKIITKGETIDKAKVWLGETGTVDMVAANDVTVVLPRANRAELKLTVKYNEPLKAPVKQGDEVGELLIVVPGQKTATLKLLAGRAEERKGMFGRFKDRLGYLVSGSY